MRGIAVSALTWTAAWIVLGAIVDEALALRGAVGAATIPLFALIDQSSITGRSYVGVLPVIAQYAVAGGLCAVWSFLLARRAPSVATVELQG